MQDKTGNLDFLGFKVFFHHCRGDVVRQGISKLVSMCMLTGVTLLPVGTSMASTDVEAITQELQQMLEGLNDECLDHARVRSEAEWESLQRSSRASRLPSDFEETLFLAAHVQCMLTQQIQIMEVIRDEVPASDWAALGGEESLQALRERLISTFPH